MNNSQLNSSLHIILKNSEIVEKWQDKGEAFGLYELQIGRRELKIT